MSRWILALLLIALVPPVSAQEATPAVQVLELGRSSSTAEVVPIATFLSKAPELVGQVVRVEGIITDVCPKMGCWMNLASEPEGEAVRIKVNDGEMVFPLEAIGGSAVAEGEVQRVEMDLEHTRAHLAHEAEEKGEEFDPSSVTEPMTVYRIWGHGALLQFTPAEPATEPKAETH